MSEQDIPAMDYDEHQRTYDAFVEVWKTGVVAALLVLIALLLLNAVTTTLGMIVAVLLTVTGVISGLIGVFVGRGGWIAPLVISTLMVLQLIYAYS